MLGNSGAEQTDAKLLIPCIPFASTTPYHSTNIRLCDYYTPETYTGYLMASN